MFVIYFLKYFKPFKVRIAIAIIFMIVVGVLTAAPLLIGKEALNALLNISLHAYIVKNGTEKDFDQGSNSIAGVFFSGGHDRSLKSEQDPEKKPKHEKLISFFDDNLEGLFSSYWTVPRDLIVQKVSAAYSWYLRQQKEYPQQALLALCFLLIAVTCIKGLASFISKYQLAYVFFLTNLQIREDLFKNVLQQDFIYFKQFAPGFLYSRINSDVKTIRQVLEKVISDGIQQPINICVYTALLLYLNFKLTLVAFVIMPIMALLLYYFAKIIRKNMQKQKIREDILSSGLTESLNNIILVKSFSSESFEIKKFHERTMSLFRYQISRRVVKFGSEPIMDLITATLIVGVLLLGSWMLATNEMRFADFVLYFYTLIQYYRPIRNIASIANKYQEARVSADRMREILALRPKIVSKPDAISFSKLQHEITFNNIRFLYGEKQILSNVSFQVRAGQRIALVGPSGGGKTTLANMIARLLDPVDGSILIDGHDLRDIRLEDWRKHIAIVTQETYLFEDSVAENIAYASHDQALSDGKRTMDRERIIAAAKAANAHDFIMELSAGYQTRIGPSGTRLSGGQRQRISIARAIYRNPQILILDEATSALDAQSQTLVQEALDHLMEGRTTFVIAHRLSTIRNVDCIYVIEEGRMVEYGTHDALMELGGRYYEIVTCGGEADFESSTSYPAVNERKVNKNKKLSQLDAF